MMKVLIDLIFEGEADGMSCLEHLPLVDEAVSQHGPPGALQVVVSVEDVLGSHHGVPCRDLLFDINSEIYNIYPLVISPEIQ